MLLKYSCSKLEKRHQKCIQNKLVVDILRCLLFEVVHDCFLHNENLYTFEFIYVGRAAVNLRRALGLLCTLILTLISQLTKQ